MNVVSKYASMVKFSHTIFALPFALTAYVYALRSTGTPFELMLLVKIILCMIFARSAAMGFNRWVDRDIDAINPRTAAREIPSGQISPRAAMAFVVVCSVLFILCAWWINTLCLILSPVALFVILSYSATKRFTAWSHIVLGVALAIAPAGAYIAVTGKLAFFPILLGAAVITWVSGFDILYSMQDAEFDRKNALHSVPARFSPRWASTISVLLHAVTIYAVIIIGQIFKLGNIYWIGTGIFIALLIMQHILYRPSKVHRIGASFGLVNGLASVSYALFAISDILIAM